MIDFYTLRARLWPALLTGLPAAAAIGLVFPGLEWWRTGLTATGAAIGLTFLFAQMARSAGKRREPELFEQWGGKPTCRYLRHRDSPLDQHTLARYHRNITMLAPELAMPSVEQEASDPSAADAAYEAATRMLINKTRDSKRFRLLFKENIQYGFCRNLWGLKSIAIAVSLASLGICGSLLYREWKAGHGFDVASAVVGGLCCVCLCCWVFWFTPAWIKVAADGYSERLLEASDDLLAGTTANDRSGL